MTPPCRFPNGVDELVAHVDLRAQQARTDLGVPDAEEARQAPAGVDEPFEALRHLLVVVRELAGVTNHCGILTPGSGCVASSSRMPAR